MKLNLAQLEGREGFEAAGIELPLSTRLSAMQGIKGKEHPRWIHLGQATSSAYFRPASR